VIPCKKYYILNVYIVDLTFVGVYKEIQEGSRLGIESLMENVPKQKKYFFIAISPAKSVNFTKLPMNL
jgi:hypothetical protein